MRRKINILAQIIYDEIDLFSDWGGSGGIMSENIVRNFPEIVPHLYCVVGNDAIDYLINLKNMGIDISTVEIKGEFTGKVVTKDDVHHYKYGSCQLLPSTIPDPPAIVSSYYAVSEIEEERERFLRILKGYQGRDYVYVDAAGISRFRDHAKEFLCGQYLVSMNKKEALRIFNSTEPEEIMSEGESLEIDTIIVTLGDEGSYHIFPQRRFFIKFEPSEKLNLSENIIGPGDVYLSTVAVLDYLKMGADRIGCVSTLKTIEFLKEQYQKHNSVRLSATILPQLVSSKRRVRVKYGSGGASKFS
jgi:sugar/nucleoside kinase (ribokinase family)